MLAWSVASVRDRSAVRDFYRVYDHQHIAVRPEHTEYAITHGNCVICKFNGDIVAAGMIIQYDKENCELAQGRVTLNGKGLYRQLILLRMALALTKSTDLNYIFCEIDEPNTLPLKTFFHLGFDEYNPSSAQIEQSVSSLPASKQPETLGYGFKWLRIKSDFAKLSITENWIKATQSCSINCQLDGPLSETLSHLGINS